MRVIAVDWSGAIGGERRKVVLAEAEGRRLVRVEDGRTRAEVIDEVCAAGRQAPRLLVGLDFGFSLPAWHLDHLGCADAPALWALVAREGERWLAERPWPFWRTAAERARATIPDEWRATERETVGEGAVPASVFKLVGPQVGTGSLRGMPFLPRLREAGFAVWPFDGPGPRVVAECWPRLFTPGVVKRDAAARARFADAAHPGLAPALRRRVLASEDHFDAAMAALGLAAAFSDPAHLPRMTDPLSRREGAILDPRRHARPPA
ncbi:MAG: hypothetical protein NW201_01535 [Gemmatimonadales bacterium]|nr:hypothetical protein [Gemmatimonadales bacterium]